MWCPRKMGVLDGGAVTSLPIGLRMPSATGKVRAPGLAHVIVVV